MKESPCNRELKPEKKDACKENKGTSSTKRIVLDEESATVTSQWIKKLREDSCRIDTSKFVNVVLRIFFKKYGLQEYSNISKEFFHKKTYLRNLIQTTSEEEVDKSLKAYLGKSFKRKSLSAISLVSERNNNKSKKRE